MGLFDNIDVDATQEVVEETVREEKSWIKDSGAYDVEVTMFRFKESMGGANGFVIDMITEDGQQITTADWFSSKSGDTTYAVKDRKTGMPNGERKDLPGMARLKAISRALTGDPVAFMNTEKATVGIWSFEKKENIDTEVDVFKDAIGKKVKILVQRTMLDKDKKNQATGNYEPSTEFKFENSIAAWTDVDTGKTYAEMAAGTDSKTYNTFMKNLEKNPVADKRKVSKNTPVEQAAQASSETPATEPSEQAKSAFA